MKKTTILTTEQRDTIIDKCLEWFEDWKADDQTQLSNIMPKDRRWSYPVRDIIKIISDISKIIRLKIQ